MAKPSILPPIGRKRGNPNWGKPIPPVPAGATEFEKQVQKLGLSKETCVASTELRKWCERNRNQCYIPEWLLDAWRITVDLSYGAPPQPQKSFERRFSRKSAA
jgi:hypothetical protein